MYLRVNTSNIDISNPARTNKFFKGEKLSEIVSKLSKRKHQSLPRWLVALMIRSEHFKC